MTEQPAILAREAKNIHQSLKESLKTKEPFDKEVDFQRKNLRRRYLSLLLVHPYAKESKDVENHLWMQTSYAFISAYKQRINTLDRAIQNQQRQQQQGQQQHQRQNGHGPVEHRKLIQRFRQFLADEEKFWTQLVLRLRRSFALTEAQPALISLGLLSGTDDPASVSVDGVDVVTQAPNGRNHFQFPPEDATLSVVPASAADHDTRLAILSKALICLGDIARYRELYNEANGRPRAGHEDLGPGRRGRNRRGAEPLPRPRNYDKAEKCYEQARLLVPYEGNPSHQLAILASYQKDNFTSIVHYYRALCVRQPYDTASENLSTVLSKSLELWKSRTRREREKNGATDPPRVRIEGFKERVVVLHALWRIGMDKGVEKMDSVARKHDQTVFDDFFSLVAERHLPDPMISNTVVLSQGALWKHRMTRDPPAATHSRRHESVPPPAGTTTIIEWRILRHLFDLHRALLEVGRDELKEPPPMDAGDDLAQRITATFRRTLPALRIASKWLRANFKYVMQDPEFAAFQQQEHANGVDLNKTDANKISGYSVNTIRFWKAYAEFLRLLARSFPMQKLPSLTAPLEEDTEMRGFSPLKKLMGEMKTAAEGEKSAAAGQPREQVHPNVEQLMRISDLLEDANVIAAMENSPLSVYGERMVFNVDIVEEERPPTHPEVRQRALEDEDAAVPIRQQQLLASIRDKRLDATVGVRRDDDEMTEITSKTDDDVVRDAFKFLDTDQAPEDEEDQEEDEIVYMRQQLSPNLGPTLSSPSRISPRTPSKPLMSPTRLSPRSPTYHHNKSPFGNPNAPPAVAPTTAQDLLNDVMGLGSRTLSGGLGGHTESSAPQAPLLFGTELNKGPHHSIWAASRDEQSLKFTGGTSPTGQVFQSRMIQPPLPQDLSQQSIWSSSYGGPPQNSQQNLVGVLPSASYALPPHPTVGGGHQRLHSSSVAAQLFPHQNQPQHDPFGYSSPMTQPPIHRPDGHLSMSLLPPHMNSSIAPGGGPFYVNSSLHPYHSRHLSLHDPPAVGQTFTSPPMSQVWGNAG